MSLSRVLRPRFFAALFLALVLSAAVYGFAAANIVPESGAGDGTGTISGYTASNIHYTLNAANPQQIDSVSFTLSPTAGASAPTDVRVRVNAGSWAGCALGGGTWSCALSGVTVLPSTSLQIVAAQ